MFLLTNFLPLGVSLWPCVPMLFALGGGLVGVEGETGVGRLGGWGGGLTGVKVESGLGCQECEIKRFVEF